MPLNKTKSTLNRFREAKAAEIEALTKRATAKAPLYEGPRLSLKKALSQSQNFPIIAEYKRASPALGDINLALSPEGAACLYASNGAAAISVLTEEVYFKGDLAFIDRIAALDLNLPLLRKDFIFHPLQVRATATTRAAAILLIVKLTPDVEELRDLYAYAESLGLEVIVEVFDTQDLAAARQVGAELIQVNARNLATLEVDKEAPVALAQAEYVPNNNELWIWASGVKKAPELTLFQKVGYKAALVGGSLMESANPGEALRTLTQEAKLKDSYGN